MTGETHENAPTQRIDTGALKIAYRFGKAGRVPLLMLNNNGLSQVVANARQTALIGVSGQPGTFTEAIVREMARHVERPVATLERQQLVACRSSERKKISEASCGSAASANVPALIVKG